MTAKRFTLAYADYDWWAICDKENPTELGISGEDVVELLNAQDKQIFLLKCVIQTITAESMDKNISHKRIIEIKKHWYDKLYGDVE